MTSVPFTCQKQPASGHAGVVVTNHPLGSAAGMEIMAAGGNAIDAAVATLLTLTVVEPMMVGIAGGGISHLCLADGKHGKHIVVDALACAGSTMHDRMYTPAPDAPEGSMETEGRRNSLGPSAVAVPGNLAGWHHMQTRYGKLPFADVVQPAIRHASNGFLISHYLNGCILESAADLPPGSAIAQRFMPNGQALAAGDRLIQADYAQSLKLIASQGASALYGGVLGDALLRCVQEAGEGVPVITRSDLLNYRPIEREPIIGTYRGYEIIGPPPPASSGVHVVQMLNMLEAFDMGNLAFDSPERLHLLAEVIRIAFADRNAHSGDPAFVDVPVQRLTSKSYAAECLTQIGRHPGIRIPEPRESHDTTHITVADRDGNIVCATHTINSLFGARFLVPEAGLIPNNYMCNYDPRPGKALSIAPGKRVPTSMAPMIVRKQGLPVWALGLPGGLRIFPSALQCIVNLIDHKMPLQQAVEAPRIWTHGQEVEMEEPLSHCQQAMQALGHRIKMVPHIGGGMNAIAFEDGGNMTGAACWRADGTVSALGGGLARPGVRFKLSV